MKTNNAHRRSRALAAALATLSLFALLGACEDPLTAVAQESVRLASLPEYTLTMLAPSDGSASPTAGTYKIKDGEPLAISATANGGYTFMGWDQTGGTGTATFASETSSSTTVSVTGGDATIQAIIDDTNYTITVTAGTGGTVSHSSLDVTQGDPSVTVTASPGAEYPFAGWTVTAGIASGITFNPNASAQSVTVTATTGDATIQANFTLKSYTLTLQLQNESYGYTNNTSITATSGTPVVITATPYPTYAFNGWTETVNPGNVTIANPSSPTTTATVTGGIATIRANFRKETVTLTELDTLSIAGTGSPQDVTDAIIVGDYIYFTGPTSAASFDSIVRRVNISTPANLITSDNDYHMFNGVAKSIIRTGLNGSEVVVIGSDTFLYKIAHSSFATTSLTSVSSGIRSLCSNGYDNSFWGISYSTGIASLYSGSTMIPIAYSLKELSWDLEKILFIPGGLLAIAENNQARNLIGFDGPEGGGPVTAADSRISVYDNGDMDGGIVGQLAVEQEDKEYLSIPIFEDNQYLRLKTYDITSLSNLDGGLVSILNIGSSTDTATGAIYDDAGSHYVYVAGSKNGVATIWIIDVSNKSSPLISGGSAKTIPGFARAVSIFKRGDYLYVLVDAASGVNTNASLKAFQISTN